VSSSYRAVVIGATGAVGSALTHELVASPRCSHVTALVRRKSDLLGTAAKLSQHVVDFDRLEESTRAAAHGCEVAFCTMGVGQPRKVPREEQWRVDVELAAAFARGCRSAGVRHISLLTSVSARPTAGNYYLRVKGAAEEAVTQVGFARTSFFRPSLLVTRDVRYGLQDRLTQALFPWVARLLPSRFRQIRVETLARAMRVNAERESDGIEFLHWSDFTALAR